MFFHDDCTRDILANIQNDMYNYKTGPVDLDKIQEEINRLKQEIVDLRREIENTRNDIEYLKHKPQY